MIHRRTFLKQTGLAIGALTLPQFCFALDQKNPIGIQLYSLRESINKNPKLILEKLAKTGFKEIETYGYSEGKFWGITTKELKTELQKNNLVSPSGHYGANSFLKGNDEELKEIIAVANQLDQKYITIPSITEELRNSKSDYLKIAEKFNQAGEMCKAEGKKLAYHNHAFEFDKFEDTNGYDILLENTDQDLVDFEMDIYWVVRAGIDPINLFQEHPGRFSLWHVKDMHKENKELNTEIGNGTIDYLNIFKNADLAGVKHYILEQENFEIPDFESLDESYQYIQNKLF